ncbi:hypothetical protein EV361DRAFT_927505 [Lentinula raphanica]|nr:hypothetical protein EV361DRAFT_927505 [Lentinula raphanica]
MRFLPPKKTHLAIFVVGVAFFAQAAAAPAPPKPENALTGMSGEVGGRHQTASTQDDPGDEFLMSGGLPESQSTQDDPRHVSLKVIFHTALHSLSSCSGSGTVVAVTPQG